MQMYEVRVVEVHIGTILVNANNKEEAKEKATCKYAASSIEAFTNGVPEYSHTKCSDDWDVIKL